MEVISSVESIRHFEILYLINVYVMHKVQCFGCFMFKDFEIGNGKPAGEDDNLSEMLKEVLKSLKNKYTFN